MEFSIALIQLAGTVALLLWGTHMVQSGMQRAFGPRLRSLLGSALRNRFTALAAGTGVTAALQSSTATGLMATGFAADGLVGLVPGLAVMLGAGIGSTLIVQLLSFDVELLAPALVLIGFVMFRRDGSPQVHDLGRVFIGLGLMLLALHQLIIIMRPYEHAPLFQILLGAVSNVPLLDLILAALLTWAVHSSVAVVLLVVSLSVNGVVPPEAAFAFVLGANLGTAVNPLLEGAAGREPAARRLPLGNLLARIAGALLVLSVLGPLVPLITALDPGRAVADFHTLFNLALALVMLPLLGPYAWLLRRLLPDSAQPVDPSRPLYLDKAAKATPAIALGGAAREALRLADVLEEMLHGARDALAKGDKRLIAETKRLDDVLDRLNAAIKAYLTSIDPDELSDEDHTRLNEILVFATNMEQAGDIVERNLLPHAAKRLKRGLAFSKDGQAELTGLVDQLIANLRTAASLLMTGDRRAARLLADEKVAFRRAEAAATEAHFLRLRARRLDTAQTSAMHLDLLRDLKQVNSHLVAAAAYPVLERSGELLPSRLAGRAAAPR
ncbi:phosphate:Na+ symporter [Tistlia consotensis]|uniref:Phosphate:Na+ symporter n=1 Tax=Tistlia consotensis USBA 355 TaxID=560819 RepID=A0A1Y6CDY0_9PROT|nr:Na/Pi cotransporter family protein [Tistlia consotensis]SMF58756.1 phosphate:Na+ symporter [Tistlia consotensis USBA 355]SNR63866.1 phosphate:Na+ symporter [Tistlia consotensis]